MVRGWAVTLQSTVVIPYPGSRLYGEALENGWFRVDPKDYDCFDMSEPVLKGGDMSPEEVKRLCDETYRLFLSPKYVLRRLLSIRSFADLKFSFRGARKVLGHIKDFE